MLELYKKSDFINLSWFKQNELIVYHETSNKEKTKLVNDLLSFNDEIDFSNVLERKKYLNEKVKGNNIEHNRIILNR